MEGGRLGLRVFSKLGTVLECRHNLYDDNGFANGIDEPVEEDDYVFIEIDSTSMADLDRMLYIEDCTYSVRNLERNVVSLLN